MEGFCACKVKCDLCQFQWLATYPVNCEKLQCPKCFFITTFEIVEDLIKTKRN